MQGDQESSGRRKTSKYFAQNKDIPKDETEEIPATRKSQRGIEEPPARKLQKVVDDNDDDFVLPTSRKNSVDATPRKKLKSGSGRGIAQKGVEIDEIDVRDLEDEDAETPLKATRKGRGGRSASVSLNSGRGGHGGRSASAAAVDIDESDEEKTVDKDTESPLKSGGRGRGGRGASAAPGGGRGRGGGRGGFMNFGERKDPPHKGEKVKSYWGFI